jgi:hypothetical protein
MNQKPALSIIVSLMLLTSLGGYGAGAKKLMTTQGNENPSFVASSAPVDPLAETAAPAPSLDFDTESEEHPLGRGTPGMALLMGGAFLHTGSGWDAAPALAARYYFPRSFTETEGPESLSPWSVELGGIFPHAVSGDAGGSSTRIVGGLDNTVKIDSFAEEHLALQYRKMFRRPFRVVPEISLGLSIAQFKNNFNNSGYNDTYNSSLGPLARIGLPILANDWFAFRMELGYVKYSNKVNVNGQSFDMGLSGLAVFPSIQVSLGYLHPGVEKGVYLPPSALPLWAISVLQTERRSPIIAPPEVALNAHQAGQGGLSGNVLFQYKNRGAQKVELLADFNHWKPEPMYMDSAHVWVTVKDLKAGPYHYVYLINGKREIKDPWNTSFDPSRRAHGVSTFVVPEVTPVD